MSDQQTPASEAQEPDRPYRGEDGGLRTSDGQRFTGLGLGQPPADNSEQFEQARGIAAQLEERIAKALDTLREAGERAEAGLDFEERADDSATPEGMALVDVREMVAAAEQQLRGEGPAA